MKIGLSNYLAYKLNFFLLIIGPTVVFFFVKVELWTAIFEIDGVKTLQGYGLKKMLEYQVWVMVVAFLAQSYNSMKLAEDIRLGRISSYLIYPFSFWNFHFANFLSILSVHTLVAVLTGVLAYLAGYLSPNSWAPIFDGFLVSLLVSILWFQVSFAIGLGAFWLEETWVLRVMFTTIAGFFSGSVIPLELYPKALVDILYWSPFPYMTFVPAKLFMGSLESSLATTILALMFWILATGALLAYIWRRGIRLYTASGM